MAEIIKTNILSDDVIIATIPALINENNEILESAINNLIESLDTELGTLSIKEGRFFQGENPVDVTLISTNGNIAANNVSLTGNILGKSVTLSGDVKLTNGNILMEAANSKIDTAGSILLGGELVMKTFGSTPINASYELTYRTNSQNNLVTDGGSVIGGLISPKNKNAIILNWSNYVENSETTTKTYLNQVLLGIDNVETGQILHVVSDLGNVTGESFYILKNTIAYSANNTLTKGIKFTDSYQVATLMFDGTNWVILNLKGAVEE